MRSYFATLSIAAALSLGSGGCIQKVLTDGQITATRQAASSFDTVGDVDLARSAAEASFGQFEGMHALAPYNTDALFLLTKSWTGYGAGFIMEEIERAQDANNDNLEEYQRKRARMAFDRAVFYGLELLGQSAKGFDEAKKNAQSLAKWLADNFKSKDDAPNLLWTGVAWLLRTDVMKGDENEGPAFVADVFVGVGLVERAVALDPAVEHYTGMVALASYHARNGMAEPEDAKKLLDQAMTASQGKDLMVPLAYATTYACVKGDAALYQDMLGRVLSAGDPDPFQRLENAIAKRRAQRWLAKHRAKDSCGIDVGAAPPPAASTPAPSVAPATPSAPSSPPAPAAAPAAASSAPATAKPAAGAAKPAAKPTQATKPPAK
jgi:hypothetical protein